MGLLGMVTKHLVSVSFFFFFFFANSGLLLTYDIILPTHRCKRYSTVLTGVLWCNRGLEPKKDCTRRPFLSSGSYLELIEH